MVNGDNATFSTTSGVMISGANVTLADVETSNGFIHVIDKVLMPPEEMVDDSADDAESSSDDDSSNMIWIILVVVLVLGGGAGAVLFFRGRNSNGSELKDSTLGGLMNQLQPIEPSQYASQQVQQTQVQPVQVQPVQTVEVIEQPVVAQPTVLNQWTDQNGYTWCSMSDGSTLWWTGTECQKHG